jgi:cGMP-dependent protein kinase 2
VSGGGCQASGSIHPEGTAAGDRGEEADGGSMADLFAVAIIGSGPAGLSAGTHAAKLGVSHILLERTGHASDTIFKYQKGKLVMSTPDVLPLRADVGFKMGQREEVLETWNQGLAAHKVNIRYDAEVVGVKGQKGDFEITLKDKSVVRAENVVVSAG